MLRIEQKPVAAGLLLPSAITVPSSLSTLLHISSERTTNPRLAVVLIEKAAALKSQVDEPSTRPDLSPSAPDIEIEPDT